MSQDRILVVDDDPVSMMESCQYLRDFGFIVSEACSAESALCAISERNKLSALVTDIDLGSDLDGFSIARRARAAYPRLVVVYTSGTEAARHLAEGVAGSTFIAKPFHPRLIAEALVRAIRLEAA